MEYKISDICNNLGIGKSTIYKRIEELKNTFPDLDLRNNDYYYYINNKLFITEKGYNYIKDFKINNKKSYSFNFDVSLLQNEIINSYKERIEFLEIENKRLLDIIALKEQKEITNNMNLLNSSNSSFFSKFTNIFKRKD